MVIRPPFRSVFSGIFVVLFVLFTHHPAFARLSVDFNSVAALAEQAATEEYHAPDALPDIVKNLNYDQWRSIRQRPEKVLWKNNNGFFNIQFFHPGFVYDRSVAIHIVDENGDYPLTVYRDWFDYSGFAQAPQIPPSFGPAGFRVHFPIKNKTYFDEFLVFLGGSYLRAIGKNDSYGLSARGLALDTALAKGEEFPWFKEFWIVQPGPMDKKMIIYALLDSPSVTGAYRFVATPGVETIIDVQCRLYFRKSVEKVGIAPLTSMYFFGENNRKPGSNDFRPEVHDSDGLQVLFDNGEWLWRPLNNPRFLQVNSFTGAGVKGFGLLQRDRHYANYEDLEAHYHERPSLWIEPLSDWGAGKVELVQIPTKDEIHDNIVAYWVSETKVQAGESRDYSYRMRWGTGEKFTPPASYVVATRISRSDDGKVRRFVVDFSGDTLAKLPQGTQLSANVSSSADALVRNVTVQQNPFNNTWRLSFELLVESVSTLEKVLPDNGTPIEVRAFLNDATDVVSETWTYSITKKGGL